MILSHDLITNGRTEEMFKGLPKTPRIVDVGCGIRPCPVFRCAEHVCIEPHAEYVEHLRGWQPQGVGKVTIIQGLADKLAEQPREGTTVLLLDVIEHMERADGERIRDLCEEFEHAVMFTPLGWCEQGDENPDGWGLNGGFWQKHRSAWMPEDFKNWNVRVWQTWHASKGGCGAFLATR
jgi:hypothetical protein